MKLLAALVVCAGCGGYIERRAADATLKIASRAMEVSKRESDVEIARAAAASGIVQLETFAAMYPAHDGFRALLAQSVCDYAVGFAFDDWEDAALHEREAGALAARANALLDRCIDASVSRLPPAWADARRAGPDAVTARLPSATAADVPALLAIANADALRLAISPFAHFAELPAIRATLARCSELRPGYRDASAELVTATLASALHAMPGGTDGAAELELARRRAPAGLLFVDVMYARGVAVARGDRKLFEATLHRVLDADVRKWPELRLSNELARRKAARYLEVARTWFADDA